MNIVRQRRIYWSLLLTLGGGGFLVVSVVHNSASVWAGLPASALLGLHEWDRARQATKEGSTGETKRGFLAPKRTILARLLILAGFVGAMVALTFVGVPLIAVPIVAFFGFWLVATTVVRTRRSPRS